MRTIAILSLALALSSLPLDGQKTLARTRADKTTARMKAKVSKDVSSSPTASLEKLISRLMTVGEVPGLSIALIKKGEVSWHKNFGVKNAETGAPLDDNTIFEAASLSKPVFAYAVMKLVDAGRLDLDTPLSKYLTELPLEGDERARLITARMVLSHTAGFQNESTPIRPLKIYFTPGERFSYSGAGFLYLQKVVEHVTGEQFDAFMKRTVFEPLKMTSSSFVWQDRYEGFKANGHSPAGVVGVIRKPSVPWAYASLHTTTLDYAKFVIAVMKGEGLKKETAEQMLKTQVRVDESCFSCLDAPPKQFSQNISWGLGWGLERIGNRKAFWHWGDNNNQYHNFIIAYPEEKSAVVIFTNSGNGHSIIPKIVSEALGGGSGAHPAFAWMGYEPYDSPAKTLFRDILSRGQAAIDQYRESNKKLSRDAAASVLSERQINNIGYWLMGKKRLKEAIEIFKLNVADHPVSANAYDSLGEAYMNNGDRELAVKNYEKSLELNPNNANAAAILKKLKGM